MSINININIELMECTLKNQFVNLTLILCEFERDYAHEPGNLSDIHEDLASYVNWARGIMYNYCFDDTYDICDVIDEEISMIDEINADFDKWNKTTYFPYINSMKDIMVESFKEMFEIYDVGK